MSEYYWEEVSNMPPAYQDNYWLDIHFLPFDHQMGWACGFGGAVLRTIDGGETWQGTTIHGAFHLESVHFPTRNVGYTSGVDGIFKSTDGGATFFDVTPSDTVNYWGCYFIDADYGGVIGGGCAGNPQHFFITTDGGNTWNDFMATEPESGLTDLILISKFGEGYASGSGRIWKTTDGGFTWDIHATTVIPGEPNSWQEEITKIGNSMLVPYSGFTCGGSGNEGGMKFTSDNGMNWNRISVGRKMFGTFLINETTGWACGYDRSVYYTTDAGQNWDLLNCGIPQFVNLDDIWFKTPTEGWVAGEGIYRLKPENQFVTKNEIDFGDLCWPDVRRDTLYLKNASFSNYSTIISLASGVGAFKVLQPASPHMTGSCDSVMIVIEFNPPDLGNYTGQLSINMQGAKSFSIPLSGISLKSSLSANDTLLIINPAECRISNNKSIKWTSLTEDDILTKVMELGGSDSIRVTTPVPLYIQMEETDQWFEAVPADTGWIEARFILESEPCGKDTTVTVRAYGVSPIINTIDSLEFNLACDSSIIRSFPVSNTGNDTLEIQTAKLLDNSHGAFSIISWASGSTTVNNIPPGEIDTLTVMYKPLNGWSHSARIILENNDMTMARGDKSNLEIELTGNFSETSLVVSDTVIDFDTVCAGQNELRSLEMSNAGNKLTALETNDVNEPFSLANIPAGIHPDELRELDIIFAPSNTGFFSDTLIIVSSECSDTSVVVVRGFAAEASLKIEPPSITASLQTGVEKDFTVNVENTGNIDVRITNISIIPDIPALSYSVGPMPEILIDPGSHRDFTFSFTMMTDTVIEAEIILDTDSYCDIENTIPLKLSSKSRFVSAEPDTLDFGFAKCKPDFDGMRLMIENNGTIPDTLTELSLYSGEFFSTETIELPYPLNAGSTLVFDVFFSPQREGVFRDSILVKTHDPDGRQFVIYLKGEFRKADSYPGKLSHDFGKIESCEDIVRDTLWIYNTGTLNDTLNINIPQKGEFTAIPDDYISVAAKGSAYIYFELDPGEIVLTGKHTELITFNSIICDKGFNYNINYEFISPELSIEPLSVDFGELWMGDTAYDTVRVRNNSEEPVNLKSLLLTPDDGSILVDHEAPVILQPGESSMIALAYTALIEGNNNYKLALTEETKCPDTTFIKLEAFVPKEIYRINVRTYDYEQSPGETVSLEIKLEEPVYKLTADSIRIRLKFNPFLLNPDHAYTFAPGSSEAVEFSYPFDIFEAVIKGEDVNRILSDGGTALIIQSRAMLYNPDSTPVEILEFTPLPEKDFIINKTHGSFTLVGYCRFVGMQRMKLFDTPKVIHEENGDIKISFEAYDDGKIQLTLINVLGQKIKNTDMRFVKGNNEMIIQSKKYPPGAYYLRIHSATGNIYDHRFIISR
ncbi:MAG: hypothetical protein ACLFQU_06365 [Candidatus Kapaibacterium sp.]